VLASYARYSRALRKLIKTSGAKVVHANDPAAFQLALGAVKLSRGVKIALNIRDTLDPGRRPPRSRYRFLFGAADHVFFLSQDMAERWAEVAPNAKSACSATYSVVDPEVFAPASPYSGDGPPVVLVSGLIWAKKGQLDFIRHVSPRLAAEGIATWLSGDFDPGRTPYMAACAEAAAPLGSMVEFLGYRTDVPQLMARSAVVAVPSRHEGLVRAMIEAMSCARPVVSFDISSAREVLERQSGGAGVVVSSGDFEAMADAIVRYCREPALAAAAAGKGRATASRLFAPEEVVSRYERVYDMLECGR
jgi:glycosyltransferase involved in cell wall biosynthesis